MAQASSRTGPKPSSTYYSNPTQVFAQSSRQFLSSRAGEKSSYVDEEEPRHRHHGQRRGSDYVSPPGYVLPPPNGHMERRQLAAQIGRSATTAPAPQSPPDRHKSSLYPNHLLATSFTNPSSDVSYSHVAPYSSYEADRPKHSSPTPSYGSSLHSPPSSTASPPPHHPHSPPYTAHGLPSRSTPQPHRSHPQSQPTYATDYAPHSKLLPSRPSKRNSTGGNGVQYPGPGAVGPALAGGIYPVLPKPPSVVGSAQTRPLSRKAFTNSRPIIDEDEAASNALNDYR